MTALGASVGGMNWDRVAREAKFERARRSYEDFLDSLVPRTSSQRPGVIGSGPRRLHPVVLPEQLATELRPVTVQTWRGFIQAVAAELENMAHDRVLLVAGTRSRQYAVVGFGLPGQFVAYVLGDFAKETAVSKSRGYRLRAPKSLDQSWWWWEEDEVSFGAAAGELMWVCTQAWGQVQPSELRYSKPIFRAD